MPFMIINSWINIMEKYGYQEFHHHNSVCDPILLASSLRKNLPVLTICSTVTWFPHPLGQQVPCMAGWESMGPEKCGLLRTTRKGVWPQKMGSSAADLAAHAICSPGTWRPGTRARSDARKHIRTRALRLRWGDAGGSCDSFYVLSQKSPFKFEFSLTGLL